MKSHRVSTSSRALSRFGRLAPRRGIALVPTAFALALIALAVPASAQRQFEPAASAPAQPAAATQAQTAPQISAPVPVAEQASLLNPFSDSNALLADGQQSAPAQSFTAPAHTQGPHHTLGKTMAILGVVALGGGVASFTLAEQHCKSDKGEVCGGLHNGGIGLMAGGGALAGVGFYWEFQKPKQ